MTGAPTTFPTFRPLLPEPIDQGDPFLIEAPVSADAAHRFYTYTTGQDPTGGRAFPVYASDDLTTWRRLGDALATDRISSHWAPCVRHVPALPRPFVMLYSCAVGTGEAGHIGHTLRRADAEQPEGPFLDSGHVLTPDLDFAIDADVYRPPDGALRCAFAMDFVADEPYGTGIIEAGITDDLTALTTEPRILARPSVDWHVYEPARVMPWKTIPGVDWATDTVRWSTVEGPVGGLVSPAGKPVYLYSGGNFSHFYAVGALIEDPDGTLHDISADPAGVVIGPDPAAGLHGPGHCSYLKLAGDVDAAGLAAGEEYLMLHARFGSPTAPRQMTLAHLTWTPDGLPRAIPVSP